MSAGQLEPGDASGSDRILLIQNCRLEVAMFGNRLMDRQLDS